MAELMLLNPSPRRRRARAKRRASPAQLAALARGRAKRAGKRRVRRAAPRSVAISSNPRRRRRTTLRAAAHNPSRRRRTHRNPISGGGITAQLMSAAYGAGGALLVDAAYTYGGSMLPAAMTTGTMKYVTKGALAIALGLLGRKVLGNKAMRMAEGSLTVTLYSMGKDMLGSAGMNLSYMTPAQTMLPAPGMAQYINSFSGMDGMGEYATQAASYNY